MKKIRNLIIVFISLIIITIITILVIKIIDKKSGSDFKETDFENQELYEVKNEVTKETNRNKYYAAQTIANKFIDVMVDGGSKSMYYMLDPTYREDFGITEENSHRKLNIFNIEDLDEYQKDNLDVKFKAKEIYSVEKSSNIAIYFVFGNVESNVENEKKEYNLIIEMDSRNNTFYILPKDYMQKNNYEDTSKLGNYNVSLEEIPTNAYNKFNFTNIEDATIINDYLSYYKESIVDDIEESYNLLDKDYRETRFDSEVEYQQYVKENIKNILSITITKYKMNQKEEYNEYICLDQNNNYYILKETAIMDYKILLDNYTIDSQEFLDKYEKANSQTKVGMNIEKVVQALNSRDYKYIYNKLDQTFKKNNFDTFDKFKEYIQENYPEKYKVEYNNMEEQVGIYQQQIRLIANNNNEEEMIEKIITMQLKDGIEFVMSFEI